MSDIKKEIGQRLKEIREFFNEGDKLYVKQFAYLLGESEHNMRNYERGLANIPISVLAELHKRGINSNYLITGLGSKYADNEAGIELRYKIEGKTGRNFDEPNLDDMPISELIKKASEYSAKAGDIMELIRKKSESK